MVKDTGAGKIPQQLKEIKVKKEQTKTDVPKINTDKTFKKNIVILHPENAFKGNNIADMTRSTAKNEKQRLYETNDTFLNNQELLKKYQYVADDKDMDYSTLRRAANNGIRTVGRVLKENSDRNTYQNVAELQVKLQSRLKSASFTAGMLDSISGDAMRIAAKTSGNQVIQNQARVMQNQLEQMKNSNPTAGMMGTVTGELAKGAAGYMTVGKAAEDAVLKNAERLKLARMKELAAARLFAEQAADTAVNTPITIAAGMADGKSRKEIGKDIGRQIAGDALINVGFAGADMAGDVLNSAIAMKKIPAQLDRFFTEEMKPNEYLKLGKSPKVLTGYGLIDGQMAMPQGSILKSAYPTESLKFTARAAGLSEDRIKKIHGHNVGFEALRQLPRRMKNPVAILESEKHDGTLFVLTDMVDPYNQPVWVSIKMDENDTTKFGTVVTSVYGKDDFQNFLDTQRNKGNVLYENKKKLQQLPSSGFQLSELFNDNVDPLLRKIKREGNIDRKALENVKPKEKKEELQQLALQAHERRKKKK